MKTYTKEQIQNAENVLKDTLNELLEKHTLSNKPCLLDNAEWKKVCLPEPYGIVEILMRPATK